MKKIVLMISMLVVVLLSACNDNRVRRANFVEDVDYAIIDLFDEVIQVEVYEWYRNVGRESNNSEYIFIETRDGEIFILDPTNVTLIKSN